VSLALPTYTKKESIHTLVKKAAGICPEISCFVFLKKYIKKCQDASRSSIFFSSMPTPLRLAKL